MIIPKIDLETLKKGSHTTMLAFDPGESTGWVARLEDGKLLGGTAPKDHRQVADLITTLQPDLIILESFALYPGKAQSLYWNSFYPCEVIGVIKYLCMKEAIPFEEQQPSVKKYAGPLQSDFITLQQAVQVTEHTKDAYQHLRYYERKYKGG